MFPLTKVMGNVNPKKVNPGHILQLYGSSGQIRANQVSPLKSSGMYGCQLTEALPIEISKSSTSSQSSYMSNDP